MHGPVARGIEFAMRDARARAHALHVAGLDDRAVADTVLVRERALDDVGDDLHVGMAVRAKAGAGDDAILVDHAQGAEAHAPRIMEMTEGEGMPAVEPAHLRA